MPISHDTLLNESEEFYKKQQEKALADKNANFDQQVSTLNQNYDFAVKNANAAYEDKYRENAIQKLINERQVAENMANMGISNSGLSRTQATATQLSYANQKAALDRQKQQQQDALERERASSLTDIESNRRAALDSVTEHYTELKQNMANSRYSTLTEAETDRINAAIEAQNKLDLANLNNTAEYNKALALKQLELDSKKEEGTSYIIKSDDALLSRDFKGSLAKNGISVYKNNAGEYVYVDNNSGKKTTLPQGTNPFTGTVNKDVSNGSFSNGYQPNNINGKKLTKVDAKINVDGNEQSVWAVNGKYYFWKGKENRYLELTDNESEKLGLPTKSNIIPTF